MLWDVKKEANQTLLAIRGAVDFEDVDAFRKLLQKHTAGSEKVILDLTDCDFLCSMAVGTILGFKIESNLNGGDLWICGASDTIRRLFEIVRGGEAVFRC